ncbi:cysteine dioxygenase [Kitasatospora sp. MMS16-BH015]|uniref:cysteine dioxygenase family protein n=1 Tax=Kitasatospora sp. MMS16-BH015 TaxID=2018025 RepID=UPI000CA11456|nr:cysteine dioxygenase family protein [Kitasatospora sp. MMS16-BH015]AUG81251.1 cysteine dioxygenase [Kitasatospora sp. MMS16-BH015]
MTESATIGVSHRTDRMLSLLDDLRAVVGRGLAPELTAYLAGEALVPFLGRADLLTAEQQLGHPDRYRQHLVHAEADGSFSLVALVWLPGQGTSIHDHLAWCTTGVHRGQETEQRYRLVSDGRTAHLAATERVVSGVGEVCGFAPPGDIHRVTNSGTETAISLHVYGADIARIGSSVRRVYRLPSEEC